MALILRKIVAKPLWKITSTLLLLLLSAPAFSLTVDGLYSAEVAVEDQSSAQMLRAKKEGLTQEPPGTTIFHIYQLFKEYPYSQDI